MDPPSLVWDDVRDRCAVNSDRQSLAPQPLRRRCGCAVRGPRSRVPPLERSNACYAVATLPPLCAIARDSGVGVRR
jgi:hypothetical protein